MVGSANPTDGDQRMPRTTPCLWFDTQAEEAANFYVSVFPNARITGYCDSQDEIDHFWHQLSAMPEQEQCGWLVDKYGLSWQVVPREINTWLVDTEPARAQRVLSAVMGMKKLDIAALQRAHRGH